MKVHHAQGVHEVEIGDEFDLLMGGRWRVESLVGGGMYSPLGLGGTPVFACRSLDASMPAHARQYVEADGTVHFCGDSIAGALAAAERAALLAARETKA